MERELRFALLVCVGLAALGCNEDSPQSSPGGAGGTDGDGGSSGTVGIGGSGGEVMRGDPALKPLEAVPRYAVVSSDYSSSSIAMLDEDFGIIDESWLNSGTRYPGLVAALSGDVVLPTRQAGDGTFAVIDRLFTDVVTRFFVPSGNLNGQMRTHGEVGDTGFSSNPQDFIFVDADGAWATRYESNFDPMAPPQNKGNDLFEVNPTDMTATGDRIDLSSLDTKAMTPDGASEVDVFARPSRGVLVGSILVVGLDRISPNFDAAGPGMVAVIDLKDGSLEGLELTGLKSCGRVVPVPGEPSKVVVACLGFAQPYGDEPQVRASSGIAVLDVEEGEIAIERLWRVADHPTSAIAVNAVIAIDAQRVIGVANGDLAATNDALYVVDLARGTQMLIYESTSSFVIGVSAYDSDSEMLFVPDAAENAVLQLTADEDGFMQVGSTEIAPGVGLPPTQVYVLD